MKVLWLCNIMMPIFSEELGEESTPFGGWLSGLLDCLAARDDIDICVCFPYRKGNPVLKGVVGTISFYGFRESDNNAGIFSAIIKECAPDIIHIWGTEYKHTYDMVMAAEECGLLDEVVISIQGLVSVIAKYHYYCALPAKVTKTFSLLEQINHTDIEHRRNYFEARGRYEVEAIKRTSHVIGRTEWDKACVMQINPSTRYHHCNESLRSSFYENCWHIGDCQMHSIFISQSGTPIKGLDEMLEAMPLILEQFPDTHLYATGSNPKRLNGWKHRLTYESYPKYIRSLLDKYSLNDKVSFLGILDETAMRKRFLSSHVFVSSSSIENSSNSIGEAMLMGMPVVCSGVGGIQSLMEHGREGFIYQWDAPYMLAHYICKIFDDESKAVEMGRCARERALITHDRKKNMRDMLGIYYELVETQDK